MHYSTNRIVIVTDNQQLIRVRQ